VISDIDSTSCIYILNPNYEENIKGKTIYDKLNSTAITIAQDKILLNPGLSLIGYF